MMSVRLGEIGSTWAVLQIMGAKDYITAPNIYGYSTNMGR